MGLMQRNRHDFNAATLRSPRRKYFSPAIYSQFCVTIPIAQEHASGDLLDIGAGDVPYRYLFEGLVSRYHTLDLEKRAADVDYVSDASDMTSVVASGQYDTVLMLEVLEHVRSPPDVLKEVFRVLREGGTLVASVPHLSRLHEEPNDFYRFTKYGLRHLMEAAGFSHVQVTARAGIFSFLGHQVSTVLICSTWHLPVIRSLVFWFNRWFVVVPCIWLDRLTDRSKLFALGYVVVAHKPSTSAAV
jgi:SAM-dependent methyltransferase